MSNDFTTIGDRNLSRSQLPTEASRMGFRQYESCSAPCIELITSYSLKPCYSFHSSCNAKCLGRNSLLLEHIAAAHHPHPCQYQYKLTNQGATREILYQILNVSNYQKNLLLGKQHEKTLLPTLPLISVLDYRCAVVDPCNACSDSMSCQDEFGLSITTTCCPWWLSSSFVHLYLYCIGRKV